MKSEIEVQTDLHDLRADIEQMKALLAWTDLKKSEAVKNQEAFLRFDDPTQTDLSNAYSHYLATLGSLRDWLKVHWGRVQKSDHLYILKELAKTEGQVLAMTLPWQQDRGN